jgi:hypothetical protein
MIRAIVVGIGIVCILAAALIVTRGHAIWPPAVYLACLGILIIVTTFFEQRYRGVKPGAGSWQATGERFIDPTTGRLTEVRYDPKTGERAYLPVDDK